MENCNEMELNMAEEAAEAAVEESVGTTSTGKKIAVGVGIGAIVVGAGLLGRWIYKKCEPKINERRARKLERAGYSVTRPAVESTGEFVEDHESEE